MALDNVALIFQVCNLSDLAPTVPRRYAKLDSVAGLHGADPSAHLDKSVIIALERLHVDR